MLIEKNKVGIEKLGGGSDEDGVFVYDGEFYEVSIVSDKGFRF